MDRYSPSATGDDIRGINFLRSNWSTAIKIWYMHTFDTTISFTGFYPKATPDNLAMLYTVLFTVILLTIFH